MQVVSALVLALCAGIAQAENGSGPVAASVFPKLEKLLQDKFWSGGDVRHFKREYGKAAIPYLIDRFTREENPRIKGKAAYCLGEFGVVEKTPEIMEFIKDTAQGTMTKDQEDGVCAALWGLGLLGTEECIDFLATFVDMTYWDNVKAPPKIPASKHDVAKTEQQFRETAVTAISLAGNDYAAFTIDRLRGRLGREFAVHLDGARKEVDRQRALKEAFERGEKILSPGSN